MSPGSNTSPNLKINPENDLLYLNLNNTYIQSQG